MIPNPNVKINCTTANPEFGTICYQKCLIGYKMTGSTQRICTAIQKWSGIPAKCQYLSKNVKFYKTKNQFFKHFSDDSTSFLEINENKSLEGWVVSGLKLNIF